MSTANQTTRLDVEVREAAPELGGVYILPGGATADPAWDVVARPDGVRVRLDPPAGGWAAGRRDLAVQAVLAFTAGERRPRPLSAILAAIAALTAGQRQTLRQAAADRAAASEDGNLRLHALLTQATTLSAQERGQIADLLAARLLRDHPRLARRAGLDLDGDEPDAAPEPVVAPPGGPGGGRPPGGPDLPGRPAPG